MAGNKNYFEDLLSSKTLLQQECLERLVEEINENKERTIFKFLGDSGSEDLIWCLVTLLSSDIQRIASNAAYIIGSLAETELGSHRVLSLTKGRKSASIIQDLTNMLKSEDPECVMNAAGTLGTLAESSEGRIWMIELPCINSTLTNITDLLNSENNWTASNAALVLARLTISEEGCRKVLSHDKSSFILTKLIQSLGNDAAGRGMNAAFAIGRLLDMSPGKERLLDCKETERMISSLCRMLIKGDMGSAKNACFAVSCLAMDGDGNQRVLGNPASQDVINRLVLLLANEEDIEAAWFSAMTLRTISCHKRGVLRLRECDAVTAGLNKNFDKPTNSKELNEEIQQTLKQLKRLECPAPPQVQATGPSSLIVQWQAMQASCGMDITYKLFDGSRMLYKGKETTVELNNLAPNTTYHLKLRASSIGDESPFSDVVTITTEEDLPSAPCFLRVVGTTPTQIRFAWNPPERNNGVLRGYSVFLDNKMMDTTYELSFIVGRLQPASTYQISVSANTSKGSGEKSLISAQTDELGAHAPGRPSVTVIGRKEAHVTWNPPSVPLGRFFRYELAANKEIIYSGTDRSFYATNLTPDTEYSFTVCAVTSEGKCESEPTKKRTPKDKSQNEPGRHKLKTHSFKAKEFQVSDKPQLEKAKTQINIIMPRHKRKKRIINRPVSCTSSMSEKSVTFDPGHLKDGMWANDLGSTATSASSSLGEGSLKTTVAVNVSAPPLVKSQGSYEPQPRMTTNTKVSIFLNKSKTEHPMQTRLPDKSNNQIRVSIEPVSWNDLFPFDAGHENSQAITRKQIVPRHKARSSHPVVQGKERSFINVMRNPKTTKTTVLRMTAEDGIHVDISEQRYPHRARRLHQLQTEGARDRMHWFEQSTDGSDTSNDDQDVYPRAREISSKLKPLSLTDPLSKFSSDNHRLFLDDPKAIVSRLKSPAKGYWSDYDIYPPIAKKKNSALAPLSYKTFTRAHRPTKSYRQESPSITDTWLSELPSAGESNKYKFIPTQMRTQPVHLPKQVKLGDRIDSVTQIDLRQNFKNHDQNRAKDAPLHHHDNHNGQFTSNTLAPKSTQTFVINDRSKISERKHQTVMTQGDAV